MFSVFSVEKDSSNLTPLFRTESNGGQFTEMSLIRVVNFSPINLTPTAEWKFILDFEINDRDVKLIFL